MRNKKHGKQLLSLLLAGLLFTSTPVSVMAETESLQTSDGIVTEIEEDGEMAAVETAEAADEETAVETVTESAETDTGVAEAAPEENVIEETTSGSEEEPLQEEGVTETALEEDTVQAAMSSDFPTEIAAGETYKLTEDITLSSGQQITNLAGTLDGQGHTITLSGTALADNVSGTIQNLGVTGTVDVTSGYGGSMAWTLTGTIKNCYSTVKINDNWNTVGGLVGTISGGTVQNCYYAAELEMMNGGMAAYASSGTKSTISNCYFQSGTYIETVAMSASNANITNCAAKSTDELKTEATVGLLNTGIADTGYIFAVSESGFPVLKEGTAGISWTLLDDALTQAESYDDTVADTYTDDTWKTLTDAVAAGKALKEQENATQAEINDAATKITDAISGLKKKPTDKPVAVPEGAIEIATQADFSKMDSSAGKYFVLTADITIDSNYADESFYMNYTPFAGVLDGQGHTIKFDNAGAIFSNLSAGAVVQNVNFKGTMTGSSSSVTGPLGTTAYGASIVNCRSEISGTNVAGFIGKTGAYMGASASLDRDGVIANCIAVGDTGKGALCNSSSSNTGDAIITNCYWLDTLGSGDGAMSEDDMKTLDLVAKLNAGKGDNGTSWGQGSDGYPYFGENQTYTPGSFEWPETEESKYQVAFKAYNGTEAVVLEDGRLEVSPDSVGNAHVAGTFSLQDYDAPEGSSLSWSFSQRKPESAFDIYEDGTFCVNGTGVAVLTAVQNNSDGSSEVIASVAIRSSRQQMTDIKLYIDGEEVTDGTYTVQGSDYKRITVKAQYKENGDYEEVSYSSFTYTADEEGAKLLSNRVNTSSGFEFKNAGTATFTVAAVNQTEMKKTVTVTSEYVPVESVVPAISGTVEIHARNANSDGQEKDGRVAFNPILGSVVVTPANATNADKVTITSDDPDETIAYYNDGEKGYVPKQAGTVTFTATIEDTDPTTGKTNTVTGDSTVTFVYKNNVKSVTIPDEYKEITVAAGSYSDKFKPEVTGELDEKGYDVTEPALKWTYSKKGIAQVVRTGTGYWKKNGDYNVNDPDYGSYLPEVEYQVMGLSEGTVIATGTPVDGKNNVPAVTITITVTKGTSEVTDVKGIANEGANNALDYIASNRSEKGYSYGNEWLVYALIQGNKEISTSQKNAYYESVKTEVKTWNASQKPTDIERTALALVRLGKDITDIDGVDLAAMIYNSSRLTYGSNELAYALLALDAANITIPSDAKWSRADMIDELLKFQNENGGFGLTDSETPSVDMTAMVLQALAPYKNRAAVKEAIDNALTYLKDQMQDDFGYGTSESTAQVLLALTVLGIDPTSTEAGFGTSDFNMITNLIKYQKDDGGFSHNVNDTKSQEMSTVQVLEALDSYRIGKTTYWAVNGEHISIIVSVMGDDVHDSDDDGTIHVLFRNNLTVWAEETEFRMESAPTAMEAIDGALEAAGMTAKKKYDDTYISSVTSAEGVELGEFTNGKRSGWLYSVNGTDPDKGACEYELSDGDVVILHYTDNYLKENVPEDHQHDFGTGVITVQPTCKSAGSIRYTCECGIAKTEIVPATGHKFGSWKKVSDATVFKAATKTRTCTVCNATETKESGSKLTPKITVNATALTLKVGQTTKVLKVTGLAKGDSVKSYKSGNKNIFTVTDKGVIKAGSKTGKATLTITLASGLKQKVTIKVQKSAVAAKKITGLKSKVTLKVGKKLTLKPVLAPITCVQKITYTSADKKIATVSRQGVITAKKAGKVKITVKAGEKKYTVTVTVTK